MSTAVNPQPIQPGFRMVDGTSINALLATPITSSQDSITATSSGNQTTAFQLTAVINRLTTVAAAADSVKLPPSVAGSTITITNSGANSAQVFGFGTDTINDVATATGVPLAAGSTVDYYCPVAGKWYQNGAGSASLTNLTVSGKLTYLATSGRVGTFVNNGATPVTVANTLVTANSMIFLSLNTVGGTVGAIPAVQTITAATNFTTKGTASDTSTYNYMIVESA